MNAFRPTLPTGEPLSLSNVHRLPGYRDGPDLTRLSDVKLALRHRESCRWLDLPGADAWPAKKAQTEAEVIACADEMRRRMAAGKAVML